MDALKIGDVLAIVLAAQHRVQLGQCRDFGEAMVAVVVDTHAIGAGLQEEPRGVIYAPPGR